MVPVYQDYSIIILNMFNNRLEFEFNMFER